MTRNRLLLAILSGAFGLFLAGCGGGSDGAASAESGTTLAPSSHAAQQADAGIPFDTLSGPLSQSAITEKRLVVVRDADAWNRLWAEHTGSGMGYRPAPAIDFSKSMVIGIFFGGRGACDTISIDAVKQGPARIEVTYREVLPPPATMCTANIVFPAILITVPQSSLPVEFVQAPARSANDLVIRSGWSFGFCADNCEAAVEIAREGAVFRARRNDPVWPERAIWGAVSAQEWETLVATFNTLPDGTIGCPDCADEGREWIEIEHAGNRKRLDFSCNVVIAQAARFQSTVREIRSRLAAVLGLPEVCSPEAYRPNA